MIFVFFDYGRSREVWRMFIFLSLEQLEVVQERRGLSVSASLPFSPLMEHFLFIRNNYLCQVLSCSPLENNKQIFCSAPALAFSTKKCFSSSFHGIHVIVSLLPSLSMSTLLTLNMKCPSGSSIAIISMCMAKMRL